MFNILKRLPFKKAGKTNAYRDFHITSLLFITLTLVVSAVSASADSTTCASVFSSGPKPAWVQNHRSPKPLSQELISAIDRVPEFVGRKTRVLLPIAAGASPEGLDALIARASTMREGVELHMWVNGVPRAIMEKIRQSSGKVSLHAHFLGPNMRELYRDGFIQLVPGYLSQFPSMVEENHPDYLFDVVLTRVSVPDENGDVSLGANCDTVCTVLEKQPKVFIIGEANKNVPSTFRRATTRDVSNSIPRERIGALFYSESKLAQPEAVAVTPVEEAIGMNLASLIDDGAVLQLGIGNIFGGLPAGLRNYKRRGIKIWTEMMGDVLQEIMQDGVATEAVTGFGFGSQTFYSWLNGNEHVRFESTLVVNDTRTIARHKSFRAVNTALQVSLTGEVNATSGPPSRGRISSPGGQVEFLIGANGSDGGQSIIAIRSTATIKNSDGSPQMISTLVPRTYPVRDGTPGAFVSHVVTEYGVASLKGKSEREKAIALIRIAHPALRVQLFMEAIDQENPDHVPGLTIRDKDLAVGGSGK